MKSTMFILFALLFCMNLQAQNDTNTQKVMKEFEKYCPLYILENYCSEKGLTKIIESAKLDERVMGINTSNQSRPKRPEIAIKYYNNVIVFEKYKTNENLAEFYIYFKTPEDLKMFARCYKYLMGFVIDENDPDRYYFEDGPSNAITQTLIPEKELYKATCWVLQQHYCVER
jgi:hypothetical protein